MTSTASTVHARPFATAKQKAKIAQLCVALGIRETLEEDVTTSEEASRLIRQMCDWLRTRRASSLYSPRGGMSPYS